MFEVKFGFLIIVIAFTIQNLKGEIWRMIFEWLDDVFSSFLPSLKNGYIVFLQKKV